MTTEATNTTAASSPLDGAVRPGSVAWELALLAQTMEFSEGVRETCQRGHTEIELLRQALRCAYAALEQCQPCSEPECAAVQQDYLTTACDAVLRALGPNGADKRPVLRSA